MSLPLLSIASENGEILFHSDSVRRHDALDAALRTACMQSPHGLVTVGKTRAYVKSVQLRGKTYLFFLDFDRFCQYYGVDSAERAAESLFDVSAFSSLNAVKRSLRALTGMFADCYKEALAADGATFEVHGPKRDVTVCLPPNAYALCLASSSFSSTVYATLPTSVLGSESCAYLPTASAASRCLPKRRMCFAFCLPRQAPPRVLRQRRHRAA